jgi:hypothetical protein
MAAGIKVFATLDEALAAGYLFYERTADGYLVRRSDGHSYALAFVKAAPPAKTEDTPTT